MGRLFDEVLAACGTRYDFGGIATKLAPVIKDAQRFVLGDDVMSAASTLTTTKPSTLVEALPRCALPYPITLLEWRGGMGTGAEGQAPREGVLVCHVDKDRPDKVGCINFMWVPPPRLQLKVMFSPIAMYLDLEGDARDLVRYMHTFLMGEKPAPWAPLFVKGWERAYGPGCSVDWFDQLARSGWGDRFKGNAGEAAALKALCRMLVPGISPFGYGMIDAAANKARMDQFFWNRTVNAWFKEITWLGILVPCLLAMINSKNKVMENEPVDVSRVNKGRARSDKPLLLPYSITRLRLSRTQSNVAAAAGMTREQARQHLVRGHFKVRRSGVFWWSPFLRGDPQRTVERREYRVST